VRRYASVVLAGGLVLCGGAAQAQGPETGPCPGKNRPGPECAIVHAALYAQAEPPAAPEAPEASGPRRRHLEQFRMLKLLELLDLDDKQEMEFLVEFKALRERQLVLQQERRRLVENLATGLREDTLNDSAIAELVARVLTLRREYALASEQFLDRVAGILTKAQIGKLVVFEERFEFELLDQVRSFRERQGTPGSGWRRQPGDSD